MQSQSQHDTASSSPARAASRMATVLVAALLAACGSGPAAQRAEPNPTVPDVTLGTVVSPDASAGGAPSAAAAPAAATDAPPTSDTGAATPPSAVAEPSTPADAPVPPASTEPSGPVAAPTPPPPAAPAPSPAPSTPGGGDAGDGLAPLASVPVPLPVGSHVIDRAAAVALGKALFWDVQAGSDGVTACASCHFRAGADTRLRNTLHPGPSHVFGSGGVTSAGQVYTLGNITNDDRVGSSGVVAAHFLGISADPASAVDLCSASLDPDFGAHRQVTGRQAPPAIAAVYNRDNFWDGRANHLFNSLDPFGGSTHPGAGVENASLASQAVGPALSSVEMSCDGRSFNGPNSLAAKLLARPPLQHQWVSPTDSVLGTVSSWPDKGIRVTYPQMIEAAFGGAMAADALNRFSHVWGEAIAAYEATLVPDRTPMDRYLAGDRTALTEQQQRGMNVFEGKGSCTKCHAGAETTDASVGFALRNGLVNEDGGDQGFHNIGVRPTAEDLGRAGAGPGGSFSVSGSPADRGAFKTPSLRNVGLTAPYFHNGGKATLMDVVDFYAAGGDFPNPEKAKRMKELSLDAGDRAELVDFLQNGLTDCRVAMEAAPFDHPSLDVADGPALPATGAAGLGSCP